MFISSLATTIHRTQSFISHSKAFSLAISSKQLLVRKNQLVGPSQLLRVNMSSSSSDVNNEPIIDIASNLQYVNEKITNCVQECNRPEGSVKLVAVSKTKPIELLMDAYNVSYFLSSYIFAEI